MIAFTETTFVHILRNVGYRITFYRRHRVTLRLSIVSLSGLRSYMFKVCCPYRGCASPPLVPSALWHLVRRQRATAAPPSPRCPSSASVTSLVAVATQPPRLSPWASLSLSRARAVRASRAQADATVASMRVRAASIIDAVTSNSKLRSRMSSTSSSLRCGSETPPTEAQ